MKKNRFFSHDCNSHNSMNILKMRSSEDGNGNKYYGIFWILIEILSEADGFKLKLDNSTYLILSKITFEDKDFIKDFIFKCINEYDLFKEEEGFFYSQSLIDRMSIIRSRSEKMKELSNRRWSKEKQKEEQKEEIKEEKKIEKKKESIKKGKNDVELIAEEIWRAYPRKEGKKIAVNKIQSLLKTYSKEDLLLCIDRYKQYILDNGIDKKFIKHGSTFFNGSFIDFLDENYLSLNEPIKESEKVLLTYIDEKTGEVKTDYF